MKWRPIISVLICLVVLGGISSSLLSTSQIGSSSAWRKRPLHPAADILKVVAAVNREFSDSWKNADLETATPASVLAVMRRASLALHGTVPSLEEIREFGPAAQMVETTVSENDLLDRYVQYLLADRRYADYVSERFARVFVGVDTGPFLVYRRRRFQLWLSDQLFINRRYDSLCRDLISSTGVWVSDPAVNFVTATITDDSQGRPDLPKLAGRTSRAFLGMRLDCLQCHDDALGTIDLSFDGMPREALQTDFHQFAAFYSQASISLGGVQDDFRHYSYTYLGDEEDSLISPKVPFQSDLTLPAGSRRGQLATWITARQNRAFSRTAVNRVWAIIFGKPLVYPVDDIPLMGPFPPGLELLATDFSDHDYDLKRLIQIITRLDVFRISSRATFDVTSQHEHAWAVFPLVRLRPEQVAGGIGQTARVRTINADVSYSVRQQQQQDILSFVKRYGDTGEDEFEDRGGTITQRLLMMNGNFVKDRTRSSEDLNTAARIATIAEDDEDAIEMTYLCVLTRLPSETELHHFLLALKDVSPDQREPILEDLFWTLINSTEFSWNH
ncbi:MAG: DUF1553 domain-containing protein [Planctomycetaceae bacterium]|nr:DUF1553 domain-containing protein [Planctomycetaceae bacterium]MBT4725224.1 DUF1553 domain-containing protein [Planctomycetaceae bacterium]MBT5123025.1 DUF1553 domain-containing protein [Planctomycetaceae bacterium]MBT5885237.1 DUF1553 domain-containing protein [Planctomycetaceae bacterium]MBT6847159.1 DUF1553 domain-containing protein [Planctomycetaceae bacterium]